MSKSKIHKAEQTKLNRDFSQTEYSVDQKIGKFCLKQEKITYMKPKLLGYSSHHQTIL